MSADANLLHAEAAGVIKRALLSYSGHPLHPAVYALRRAMDWNDLQVALSRASRAGLDVPTAPARIAAVCDAVDEHVRDALTDCLHSTPLGHNA
jgi:hypothetical protein